MDYAVKPEEIYDIIEHFCLGRRRLHLFGSDSTIRPGTRIASYYSIIIASLSNVHTLSELILCEL